MTIKKLDETKHVIKSVDIARELDFSRASVHKMLQNLKSLNYITQEHYSSVKLTTAGVRAANSCARKYSQLKQVLEPYLHIDGDYDLAICSLIELM